MNFELDKGMCISIKRIDSVTLVGINGTEFKVSDYRISSSADGTTELDLKITGNASLFEASAS